MAPEHRSQNNCLDEEPNHMQLRIPQARSLHSVCFAVCFACCVLCPNGVCRVWCGICVLHVMCSVCSELYVMFSSGTVCVMHCVSAYPAKKDKINLNSIPYLKKRLKDVTIGYSDHTTGYDISIFSNRNACS